jgi:hypothetical protein
MVGRCRGLPGSAGDDVSDCADVQHEPEGARKASRRPRSSAPNVSADWPRQDPGHDDDRQQVVLCIAAARIGTFDWDLASGRLTGDELLLELFGFHADTFGSTIEELNGRVHPQDRTRVTGALDTAVNECGDCTVEYRITLPSTGDRCACARGRAMCDEGGTTSRILGAAWDVTEARERRRAPELPTTTIAPGTARGCQTWPPGTRTRPDAALPSFYAQLRLAALADKAFVVRALRSGEPQIITRGATAAIQAALIPGPAHQVIDRLAPDPGVVLLLKARGRTVGLLSLFSGPARAAISPEELATATDVAGRAGMALDNARLYRQQRDLAEGLQRSLPTPPPEPDQVQVVVRYSPAAEAAQVGGDWYDVFVQPGGATVLAIGDVIGHDTKAAAAMGQLRGALRTIGALDDDGPAEVLRKVDRVMRTLQVGGTATAVVAHLEQTPHERSRGLTRVRWSNAGHPPPLALDADGTVLALDHVQPDLMLGMDPGSPRRESQLTTPGRRHRSALHRRPDRAPETVPRGRIHRPAAGSRRPGRRRSLQHVRPALGPHAASTP